MSDTDIMKMKVADLKRELRLRALPTTGNKNELQERLQAALIDGELSLEDTAINEDLLDEDGLTDEEEKAVLDSPEDESVLISPPKLITDNRQPSVQQQPQQQPQSTVATKKVVLKRKNSVPKLINTDQSSTNTTNEDSVSLDKVPKLDIQSDKTESNNNAAKSDASDQKKVIKLSELSLKERLEMRAKKFGTKNASEGSKSSGKINNDSISVSGGDGEKDEKQIQTLKKRAERFGCVISSKIADIEKKEKLLKRQQRFGLSDNNSTADATKNGTTTTTSSNNANTYAEKAKLRLERFKTPAATVTK